MRPLRCGGMAIGVLVAAAACDAKRSSEAATSRTEEQSSAEAELPSTPLEAKIGGRRVALKTLRSYRSEGRAIHLFFSDAVVPCADIVAGGRGIQPGETVWGIVTIAPAWLAGGAERWRVIRVNLRSNTRHAPDLGPAQLLSSEGEDDVRLRLHVSAAGVALRGEAVAKTCGPSRTHPTAPQPGIVVTCDERVVGINAALLFAYPSGDYRLALSTAGRTCKPHEGIAVFEDVSIDYNLDKLDNGRVRIRAPTVSGTALMVQTSNDPIETWRAYGPLKGEGKVRIELKGSIDVGPCKLNYDGEVEATRCPPG